MSEHEARYKYLIVGLSGKAGSGKDFLAQSVVRPLGFVRWSFSWHMKNQAVGRGICSWKQAHVEKPAYVRNYLQQEGTERGWKIFGPSYWPEVAEAWMLTMLNANGFDKFVVADVRFPHEADWIKALGGLLVRVEAPERVRHSSLSTAARAHDSETALDDYTFDNVINNDYDLAPVLLKEMVIRYLDARSEGELLTKET